MLEEECSDLESIPTGTLQDCLPVVIGPVDQSAYETGKRGMKSILYVFHQGSKGWWYLHQIINNNHKTLQLRTTTGP